MKRQIINIDEDLCNGCGNCIPGCPEGAIQMIDGKARLVSDLFCDGLGACIGECPVGAIRLEEREAEPYAERTVMANIVKGGANVIKAHLAHLADHGEEGYLKEALDYLAENNIAVPEYRKPAATGHGGGCPGSAMRQFGPAAVPAATAENPSALGHWPIQLHLANPQAPHYRGADVLLAADCTAFALGAFHGKLLSGKSLAIACPKLDENQDAYLEKLVAMIDGAAINTLTVAIMQVPCCGGLLRLAEAARERASRVVPLRLVVVGIEGGILKDEWVR